MMLLFFFCCSNKWIVSSLELIVSKTKYIDFFFFFPLAFCQSFCLLFKRKIENGLSKSGMQRGKKKKKRMVG